MENIWDLFQNFKVIDNFANKTTISMVLAVSALCGLLKTADAIHNSVSLLLPLSNISENVSFILQKNNIFNQKPLFIRKLLNGIIIGVFKKN